MDNSLCAQCSHPIPCLCPPTCMENAICRDSEDCIDPVVAFCLCRKEPLLLCQSHKGRHTAAGHEVFPMRAYAVARQGYEELRRYEMCFGTTMAAIETEKGKLSGEKADLEGFLGQLEGKVGLIRDYLQAISGKIDSFAQLEVNLERVKYFSHPRVPIQDFLASNGLTSDGSSTIHSKLAEVTGSFYHFDLSSALKALTLIPTASSFAQAGLKLINAAASEIANSKSKVVTRESSLCFLSESQLFACGPTAKACFITETGQRVLPSAMTEARRHHGLVKYGERVFAFGGVKRSSSDIRTWESLDLDRERWEKGGEMQPRRFANPTVIGAKIYLAGGYAKNPIEEFDPATCLFRPIPCSVPIRHFGIALSLNQCLVVLSGEGVTRCSENFAQISQTPLHQFPASLQLFSVVAPLWSGEAYFLLVTEGHRHVKLTVSASAEGEPEVCEVE